MVFASHAPPGFAIFKRISLGTWFNFVRVLFLILLFLLFQFFHVPLVLILQLLGLGVLGWRSPGGGVSSGPQTPDGKLVDVVVVSQTPCSPGTNKVKRTISILSPFKKGLFTAQFYSRWQVKGP